MNQQEKIETLATKVMGWIDYSKYYWLDPANDNPHRNLIRKIHEDFSYGCWNPYESIADAWMIVDRLFGFIKISRQLNYNHAGNTRWCVGYKERLSYGATPQEAICEAALKVME